MKFPHPDLEVHAHQKMQRLILALGITTNSVGFRLLFALNDLINILISIENRDRSVRNRSNSGLDIPNRERSRSPIEGLSSPLRPNQLIAKWVTLLARILTQIFHDIHNPHNFSSPISLVQITQKIKFKLNQFW